VPPVVLTVVLPRPLRVLDRATWLVMLRWGAGACAGTARAARHSRRQSSRIIRRNASAARSRLRLPCSRAQLFSMAPGSQSPS
jgi:hypothetical protein